MQKKRIWIYIVIVIILLFLILLLFFNKSPKETDLEGELGTLRWNYGGAWIEGGFDVHHRWENYPAWLEIRSRILSKILKYVGTYDDGKITLDTGDQDDEITYVSVDYDKETGHLRFYIETSFIGISKNGNFQIFLNGDPNVNNYVNLEDYDGMTFEDLVIDVLSKGNNLSLISGDNNFSLNLGEDEYGNPEIDMDYDTVNVINFTAINLTSDDNVSENISEKIDETSLLSEDDKTSEDPKPIIEQDYKIFGYSPIDKNVVISAEENIVFSIENNNYDSIIWYVEGKARNARDNFLSINKLMVGNYEIRVDVTKQNQEKSHVWNLRVEEIEEPKKINIFFISFIVFLVISVIIGVLFFFKTKRT